MRSIVIGLLLLAGLVACKGKGKGKENTKDEAAPAAAPREGGGGSRADDLQRYLQDMIAKLEAQDPSALQMIQSLVPDEAAVRKVVRDGTPADKVAQLIAGAKQSLMPIGGGFTKAEVHFATAKEIAEQTGTEWGHFTGAELAAAQSFLRPEVTFYTVHFTKPSGLDDKTFHMCFWDGKQWRTLGRIAEE